MDERAALKNVVDAWEALRGGQRYSPTVVEWWMRRDMKPAIDAARVVLKNGAVKIVAPGATQVNEAPQCLTIDDQPAPDIRREPFYDGEAIA